MNNFELEIFKKIMQKGIFLSEDDNTDNQLYNLQLMGYIKLHILVTGKLMASRIWTKKTIALTNQLNIKEIE